MNRFNSTHWSIVLRARESTGDARAALDVLCRAYRAPVLAYIRGRGYKSDADDLAQAFFARLLEDEFYAMADPSRGRFRAFLITALKRFLINADTHARTLKRGGGNRIDSIDQDGGDCEHLISGDDGPERAFERSWALSLLDAALRRLRAEAEEAGKREMFDQLQEFLTESPDEADYARAAAALNLRRNTFAVAVHRLRHRLRELVREELLQTTAGRDDLDLELRVLRGTLANVMTQDR